MAVVHEITARADAGEPPALDGADIHRHAFTDGAGRADLEPRRLTAIAEILGRAAKHDKRRDHATLGDRGVAHNLHMRDQRTTGADHGVLTDGAVRTNGRALADHGAVLNPRGGIDPGHRHASSGADLTFATLFTAIS